MNIDWKVLDDIREVVSYPVRKHDGPDGFSYVLAHLKTGTVCNVQESNTVKKVKLNVPCNEVISTIVNFFKDGVKNYDFFFDFGSSHKRAEFLLRVQLEDYSIFKTDSFDEFEIYVLEFAYPIAYMLEFATFDGFDHNRIIDEVKWNIQRMCNLSELKYWISVK